MSHAFPPENEDEYHERIAAIAELDRLTRIAEEEESRTAAMVELDEQLRVTERYILRLQEQSRRAVIRHANYSLERSRLFTRIAAPVHFTPEPSACTRRPAADFESSPELCPLHAYVPEDRL